MNKVIKEINDRIDKYNHSIQTLEKEKDSYYHRMACRSTGMLHEEENREVSTINHLIRLQTTSKEELIWVLRLLDAEPVNPIDSKLLEDLKKEL